jgi:cytochrome c biogenesis protein CcdA
MGELLIGTTLLASFLGGVVALLAPCCVSVMLPAYLSTGFRHRGGVVAATLVFAAGVATLILPIGLGATALSRLLFGGHVWVFSLGGAAMILAGLAVLTGWSPKLPMPGARTTRAGSYRSAYLLGMFSGAASACCAPVLAGVAVLSGAAGSFPVALAVGLAYVAGMVSPLALVALIWDVRRENAARAVTDKKIVVRWGHYRRSLPAGTAISGVLMIAMGALSIALAVTGPGMPSSGWQTELSGWLQHLSATTLHAVSWLPGWALLTILTAGFAVLVGRAIRRRPSRTSADDHSNGDDIATIQEGRR